jgi:hypothetical protein
MEKRIKEIRITVAAVYDNGDVVEKIFIPKDDEEPEDAVIRFDQWIEDNSAFEFED